MTLLLGCDFPLFKAIFVLIAGIRNSLFFEGEFMCVDQFASYYLGSYIFDKLSQIV